MLINSININKNYVLNTGLGINTCNVNEESMYNVVSLLDPTGQ